MSGCGGGGTCSAACSSRGWRTCASRSAARCRPTTWRGIGYPGTRRPHSFTLASCLTLAINLAPTPTLTPTFTLTHPHPYPPPSPTAHPHPHLHPHQVQDAAYLPAPRDERVPGGAVPRAAGEADQSAPRVHAPALTSRQDCLLQVLGAANMWRWCGDGVEMVWRWCGDGVEMGLALRALDLAAAACPEIHCWLWVAIPTPGAP